MKTRLTLSHAAWRRAALSVPLAAITLLFLTDTASAQNYTIQNNGSSATVNLGDSSGGTGLIGMNSWNVDSQNQLDQQWFYYSVNGGGVQSIDQLGGLTPVLSADKSTLTATYANSELAIQVQYQLTGTSSGGADLSASVYVFNLSNANLNVNFYQYGNFDLLNEANTLNVYGDTVNGYSSVVQSASGTGSGIQETINQPYANYAAADSPGNVMADIHAGTPLNGPYSASGSVAWAFEWNSSVVPYDGNLANAWNALQDQNMDIQAVPEPAPMALIALGLGALGFARRTLKRNV
jgi:hypothetical protein